MLIVYYIILAINISIAFTFLQVELKRLGPASVFWFSVLATFLLPSVFDPLLHQVQAHEYSTSFRLDLFTLVTAQLYVLLFFMTFTLGYLLTLPRIRHRNINNSPFIVQLKTGGSNGLYWLMGFLALSIFAVFESYRAIGFLLFTDFGFVIRRESLSSLSVFLLSYNLIICGGVLFWLVKKKLYIYTSFVLLLYLFLYFVMGGSRQPLVILLLPFVIYYLSVSRYRVFYSLMLVIFFNVFSRLLEFMLYLRNLPGLEARLDAMADIVNLIFNSQEKIASSESSLRFAYYYFIQAGGSAPGFGELSYLVRTLLFWLPSRLDFFAIKPMDFEYTMFEFYMPGYQGTMHPTFFGSVFADSGWFLLPWAIFLILVYRFIIPLLAKFNGVCFFAAWGLSAYFYMMIARGAFYGPFVALVFGLILIYIFQLLSSVKKPRDVKK
tara:strand:- start:960 stop:2270 length:1311 start_codon:yes stop_codon:yes gene_type:complete